MLPVPITFNFAITLTYHLFLCYCVYLLPLPFSDVHQHHAWSAVQAVVLRGRVVLPGRTGHPGSRRSLPHREADQYSTDRGCFGNGIVAAMETVSG